MVGKGSNMAGLKSECINSDEDLSALSCCQSRPAGVVAFFISWK